jgi:hypothetical protein
LLSTSFQKRLADPEDGEYDVSIDLHDQPTILLLCQCGENLTEDDVEEGVCALLNCEHAGQVVSKFQVKLAITNATMNGGTPVVSYFEVSFCVNA